jgi:hypothetical protein
MLLGQSVVIRMRGTSTFREGVLHGNEHGDEWKCEDVYECVGEPLKQRGAGILLAHFIDDENNKKRAGKR